MLKAIDKKMKYEYKRCVFSIVLLMLYYKKCVFKTRGRPALVGVNQTHLLFNANKIFKYSIKKKQKNKTKRGDTF